MSHFDANKIYNEHGHIDLFEIHREASVLRAKAINEFFSALFARFRITPTVIATEA